MREAVKSLSAGDPVIQYNGDSSETRVFDNFLTKSGIDVLLLDMDLETQLYQPLTDCYNYCVQLQKDSPLIRIVLHSPYVHSGWISKFMALGVTGFVSKNSMYSQVAAAVRAVYAGELFVCPVIIQHFSNYPEFLADRNIPLKMIYSIFSAREMEVLDLISRGLSTKDMSVKLFVSEKTVETHRKNIIDKAGVKNTAELIRFVSIRGLLMP